MSLEESHPPSITVELGAVNFTIDELTSLYRHRSRWLKSKGLEHNEENTEAYLKEALLTFIRHNTQK